MPTETNTLLPYPDPTSSQFLPAEDIKALTDALETGRDTTTTGRSALRSLGTGSGQAASGADAQLRSEHGDGFQQGVVNATNLQPTTVSGGTQIDAGAIWIKSPGGPIARHFLTAPVVVGHAANGSTNQRIDSVVATYVGWGAAPTIQTVQGNALSIDNAPAFMAGDRTGAPGDPSGPALPANSVILRDVRVNSGAGANVVSNAIDRRPWSRGAFARATGAGSSRGPSASDQLLAPGLLRVECSGNPVRITLHAATVTSTTAMDFFLKPYMDGSALENFRVGQPTANEATPFGFVYVSAVLTGSHLFGAYFNNNNSGTQVIGGTVVLAVEEIVKQVANNGTA